MPSVQTNYNGQIGLPNLPNQRYKLVTKRGTAYNLMVVGASGLGKTTFINTLFGGEKLREWEETKSRGKATEVGIHVVQALVEEKGFPVRLSVIDTPGFADQINNTDSHHAIVEFIDAQMEDFLIKESKPERSKEEKDTRVHVVVYFLYPTGHGVPALDIVTMQSIGARCNLVPVIAKCDMLTQDEITEFKAAVRALISENRIKVFSCPIDEDDIPSPGAPEDGEVNSSAEIFAALPYAVISSTEEVTNSAGKKVKGRQYPWGVAEVENDAHCDFRKLRSLLIRTHMHDLIHTTETTHYEKYRCKRLGGIQSGDAEDPEMRQRMKLAFEQRVKSEEESLRQRFTEQVKQEEMRFRKWEKKLIEERDQLNQSLQKESESIKALQAEVQALEKARAK